MCHTYSVFQILLTKVKVNFENVVNFVDICIPRDDERLVGCPTLTNNLDAWSQDLSFIAPVTP